MRLLKFFLYVVLFCSLSWGTIILAGPVVLKWLVVSYSNGRITLDNVEITPQLQLSVGRVYFSFDKPGDQIKVNGVLRSLNINWSLSDGQAFLKLSSGPTVIDDFGRFDTMELVTQNLEKLNFNNLKVFAFVTGAHYRKFGAVEVIEAEAYIRDDFSVLSDLSVTMERFKPVDPTIMNSGSFSGNVSDIKLDVPLNSQKISVDFSSEKLSSELLNFNADELSNAVDFESNQIKFDMKFEKLTFQALDGTVENLNAQGEYANGIFITPLEISALNGSFADDRVKLSNIFAELESHDQNKFLATVSGTFDSVELFADGTFIGSLPPNKFSMDLTHDISSGNTTAISNIKFINQEFSRVNGSFKLTGQIKEFSNPIDCLSLGCGFSNLKLTYQIGFGDESIFGESSCYQSDCFIEAMTHKILTTNTKKIFDELNDTRILSPLFSIYLYGAVSAGRKLGLGHEINFN